MAVTWGEVVVFAGYYGFLHHLQLASYNLVAIWQKKLCKPKFQIPGAINLPLSKNSEILLYFMSSRQSPQTLYALETLRGSFLLYSVMQQQSFWLAGFPVSSGPCVSEPGAYLRGDLSGWQLPDWFVCKLPGCDQQVKWMFSNHPNIPHCKLWPLWQASPHFLGKSHTFMARIPRHLEIKFIIVH